MPALKRPSRDFSFANYAKNHPREPLPADRLDVQIQNLVEAIYSTQVALADIRRDDGQLRNQSVGADQLAAELKHTRAEIDSVEARVIRNAQISVLASNRVTDTVRDIDLRARDAENAAVSAAEFLSAVNRAHQLVEQNTHRVINLTDTIDDQTTDAENWANYALAQASVAETNQEQAGAWAEYLAGPVVNPNDAPAYIAGTPWGRGLYYQPVEGGLAGLWSAKWWALYAQALVGPWGFYYLGGWANPPIPGSSNPSTGVAVPAPIAPGSFYYNTTTGQIYVWNGTSWVTPNTLAAGLANAYVYVATAGQKVFSGPDANARTPVVGSSPSDVHLNGVKLVPTTDYSINTSTNTLTLVVPATINSIVQWDLLASPATLAPGAVNAFKVQLTPPAPDGSNKIFTMQYMSPTLGLKPVNISDGSQLQVSLDGIVQEPGGDYTATAATLTFALAPPANSHFWAVWFANSTVAP